MMRQLLPAAILLQLALGWLLFQGVQARYLTAAAGFALFVLANILILGISVRLNAARLDRTEEKLRESMDSLRTLVENLPQKVFMKDRQSLYVYCNTNFAKDLGIRPEKFAGKSDYDFFPRELAEKYREDDRRIMETGVPEEIEERYIQEGKERLVLTVKAPVKDDQGKVVGLLGVFSDVTERKAAEEKLHAASLYARSLLEASLDPLVTISPEGKITDVNDAAVKATGIPREKLVGSDFSNYFTETEKARAGYRQVFEKGYVTDYPLTLRHVSGNLMDVLYNAAVYRDEKGNVAGVFAAARDITERKAAEEKLHAASLYARSLLEASLDPLVTISPEGKITDVNDATVKATGIPREKLVGSDFSDYFTETEKARAGYRQVFEKGYVTDYPLTLRHVSGNLMDVLYNAAVYRDEKGNVMGVFAAARDITERKAAEDELQRYKEHLEDLVEERTGALEAANKELESFAYSVSHDLRVPLRAVDGFSGMILKRYEGKLDGEGRRLLNVVRDNTKKMAQLIDDILAFSRMGRVEMAFSSIDMENLARQVWDQLKSGLEGRSIKIDFGEIPQANGDASMLRQVWMNLLSNAVKFTRPKEQALIEIGGRMEGDDSIYYVKDNGVGFDMQYVDKLFGVFQRLHGVEEFEGTGIGLAIVKRIVTRHGGRIWAEGKVGTGAAFYFTLKGGTDHE